MFKRIIERTADRYRILQSGIVEFVIGKDRRRFQIHAALAGSFPKEILQPSLNHEIDEVVFGRCCDFVYSGSYTVPEPISSPSGSNGDQLSNSKAIPQRSVGRWNPVNLTKNAFHPKKLPNIYDLILEQLDQKIVYDDLEVPNKDPAVSYADVFLSHAQVYRLGHRTDWVSLCALSLYRLTRSLARFTLFEERTGDIVGLLRFVFEESEDMKNMQDILLDYAAWNIEILMCDADFPQLLERVPSLEKAIFRSMWR
jgi:hypothetical protein